MTDTAMKNVPSSSTTTAMQKHEKEMLERYPCPRAPTLTLTHSTTMDTHLTQNNYRSRIHELLYIDEIAQFARFNSRYILKLLSNDNITHVERTAKCLPGELFALIYLNKNVSEDTLASRLILSNCSSVSISPVHEDKKRYEAVIVIKDENLIYLKLGSKCVQGMQLKLNTDILVDIQFQLNRLPYCEWHHAVDKITDFKIIFPATEIEPNIPCISQNQWSESCEPKLNAKQKEAVNAITTPLNIKLPPILLIGPVGTGKTYTLAQAIKQLLTQPKARILICTRSNSAADLYIKEYLHPWIEAGMEEATALRVYYHKQWVGTVNSVVHKFCFTDDVGYFRRPTVEDIMKHRIVVVPLSVSMELANLDLPKGYFTHIFLDEAAKAMECEAIMPLALANDSTRIVLAGDHMQMSPKLFSAFAKERKLHISLLERLYDHYPSNFPCKILLCENYRAHEAIIKFTSEVFYEQTLTASGKQPRYEKFYPLTFFTTRGEDVPNCNSTSFYNDAEVREVVRQVSKLRKNWPRSWGKMNDASIGIMTPYVDQLLRINLELIRLQLNDISVKLVQENHNKQFRAVFLSTVRTRKTCLPANNSGSMIGFPGQTNNSTEDADYGFLSNSKLLNTAITQAQSLVAVVGDPVALCSIGRCRKVWERFIEVCDENKSLFGLTMCQLQSQLGLNALAPEFVPHSQQPEAYLGDQVAMASNNHHPIELHQIQNMYDTHSAAANGYRAALPHTSMVQGGHHFHDLPYHMPMLAMGPPLLAGESLQQTQSLPTSWQQFNPSGVPRQAVYLEQPPAPGTINQFSQYMPWQHAQQQLHPAGGGGANFSTETGQQPCVPSAQNPNANLWVPPPQRLAHPQWEQLQQQQSSNAVSNNDFQIAPVQTGQNMNGNRPLLPLSAQQQQQMRNNHDGLDFRGFSNDAYNVKMELEMVTDKAGYNFHGRLHHLLMQEIGPLPSACEPQQQMQSALMSGEQFNARVVTPQEFYLEEPTVPGTTNQFSQYIPWQHAQQQLHPKGMEGANFLTGSDQQPEVPSVAHLPPRTYTKRVVTKWMQLNQQQSSNK